MYYQTRLLVTAVSLLFIGVIGTAIAAPVTIPNTFTGGTAAVASEVNDNFSALAEAVNDNDERVVELLESLIEIQKQNSDLLDANAKLTTELSELATFVDDLRAVLSLQDDNQGNPAVVFSAVNVHVNNGTGATESVNGLGNLIIGYDEPNQDGDSVCSDGFFNNEPDCVTNGAVFQPVHKNGSHTLVVGPGHNYSQMGGLVAGRDNTVTGLFASASGGERNRARGTGSSVSGGRFNSATGRTSSISGGSENLSAADASSISGGQSNLAIQTAASVSGGRNNRAEAPHSSISGGSTNVASGGLSSVSGGSGNVASGGGSSVSGGVGNEAAGTTSSVSGGRNREAADNNDWVGGSLTEDQ